MKNRCLCLFLLLVLCVLSLSSLAEGKTKTYVFPNDLTIIEKEAFSGTKNADRVVFPEGIRRIESRAFEGSSVREAVLPRSLEYIAHDAFDGCENLTLYVYNDSYAHRWAALNQLSYILLDGEDASGETYMLSQPDISGNEVSVYASTGNAACVLVVRLLSEDDETVLTSKTTDAEAGLKSALLILSVDTRPAYFILEAVLEDENGNALCAPVRNLRYTRAHDDFENQDTSAYPESRVIDLGSSGHMVLAENVVYVPGAKKLESGVYSIPSSASRSTSSLPKEGDVLMLNVGGAYTPVKVSSAVMGADGTITIEESKDITLSDVCDRIDIKGYIETDGSGAGAEVGNTLNYDEQFTYLDGDLVVDVDAGMDIFVIAEYDKEVYGKNYFYFDVEGDIWGNVTATFTGEFSTSDLEKPIELVFFDGFVLIPGINLPTFMKVSLPIDAHADGTGTVTTHFEKSFGFSVDSSNGFMKRDTPAENWSEAQLEVEFGVETGPKIALEVGIWDFIGATIDAQVGIIANGRLHARAHAGDDMTPDQDKLHACNLCLGLDVDIFAKANADIHYNITYELSDTLFEKELFSISGDLLEKHNSLSNETDSYYKGVPTKGDGPCPNYMYKVDVSAEDMYEKPVESIPVTITCESGKVISLTAPESVYLYEGTHTSSAVFPSGTFDERFSVLGATAHTVKEREMILSGSVINGKTEKPLSGARITLTMPDGSTKTASSDKNGFYKFDKLPGGTYTIVVSKDGFFPKSLKDMTYKAGTNNQFNASLYAETPLLSATLRTYGGNYSAVYAKASDGSNPGFTLKLEPTSKGLTGGMYSFRLTHSGLSTPFTMESTCYTIILYAADMGNGEYTYVLTMYSDIDNHCIVLREGDDRFEVVLDFTHLGRSGATCGEDGNPEGFVDYNGAQYDASSTTGPFRQEAEFILGDEGGYILRLTTEEANFVGGTTPIWEVTTDYEMIGERYSIKRQTVEKW